MKYWHRVWPYGLLIINVMGGILIIYEGQIFTKITTLLIHLLGTFVGLGEIATRYSK